MPGTPRSRSVKPTRFIRSRQHGCESGDGLFWTAAGLTTYYVLSYMRVASRHIHLEGSDLDLAFEEADRFAQIAHGDDLQVRNHGSLGCVFGRDQHSGPALLARAKGDRQDPFHRAHSTCCLLATATSASAGLRVRPISRPYAATRLPPKPLASTSVKNV